MASQQIVAVIQGHPDGASQLKAGTTLRVVGYSRLLVADNKGNVETIKTIYMCIG